MFLSIHNSSKMKLKEMYRILHTCTHTRTHMHIQLFGLATPFHFLLLFRMFLQCTQHTGSSLCRAHGYTAGYTSCSTTWVCVCTAKVRKKSGKSNIWLPHCTIFIYGQPCWHGSVHWMGYGDAYLLIEVSHTVYVVEIISHKPVQQ